MTTMNRWLCFAGPGPDFCYYVVPVVAAVVVVVVSVAAAVVVHRCSLPTMTQ